MEKITNNKYSKKKEKILRHCQPVGLQTWDVQISGANAFLPIINKFRKWWIIVTHRRGIWQILTPAKLNFIREKRLNCNISGKIIRMEDVLFIYFEQIVSFYAPICSILVNSWKFDPTSWARPKTNVHERGSWCSLLIPSLMTDDD